MAISFSSDTTPICDTAYILPTATALESNTCSLQELNITNLSILLSLITGKVYGSEQDNMVRGRSKDEFIEQISLLQNKSVSHINALVSKYLLPFAVSYDTDINSLYKFSVHKELKADALISIIEGNDLITLFKAMRRNNFNLANISYLNFYSFSALTTVGVENPTFPFSSTIENTVDDTAKIILEKIGKKIGDVLIARNFLKKYMLLTQRERIMVHDSTVTAHGLYLLNNDILPKILNALLHLDSCDVIDEFEIVEHMLKTSWDDVSSYASILDSLLSTSSFKRSHIYHSTHYMLDYALFRLMQIRKSITAMRSNLSGEYNFFPGSLLNKIVILRNLQIENAKKT